MIINDRGELLSIRVTQGNVDDRSPVRDMCRRLVGKLFGDKGCLSQTLTQDLLQQGLRRVTGLRKRSLIETVIDQPKNISQIQHTRHRSPASDLVNILAGLAAYPHQPQKPSLHPTPEEIQLLELLAEAQLMVA